MKKLISFALGILLAASLPAQQALSFRAPVVSPEINADHSVTFRYRNPKAMTVKISGDFLPDRTLADMVEGKDGVWEYTTGPLEGELYLYNFIVDGERRNDPSNMYQNRDIATWTNFFTLSTRQGDKGWYYETHAVPHGSLLRFAEVLLVAAEAHFAAGNTAKATEYVNEIRRKAQIPELNGVSLADIKAEKRFELCREGQLFQDLIRWGDAYEKLKDVGMTEPIFHENGTITYFDCGNPRDKCGFKQNKHELLPFPANEVRLNDQIVQNPGY